MSRPFRDEQYESAVRQNRLLPSPEAADYIGRSVDFVRRTLKHECPYVQHGTRGPMGFWTNDLDRWLDQNTRQPVSR